MGWLDRHPHFAAGRGDRKPLAARRPTVERAWHSPLVPARRLGHMPNHPTTITTGGTAGPRVYSRRRGAIAPPPGAIYVGRPTAFGNPFEIGRDGDRARVIERYRLWLAQPEQAELRDRVRRELRGRDLTCWCAPLPCHADTLLELANR